MIPRRTPRASARPMPITSRPPASVFSPTTAATFDVPTSSPTRYRSRLLTRPPLGSLFVARPFGVATLRRPHVHPLVEANVHVVDVGHPRAQRRRHFEIGLQPFGELAARPRGSARSRPRASRPRRGRRARRSAKRDAPVPAARQPTPAAAPRAPARASSMSGFASSRPRTPGRRSRQIEIGVLRTVLVDDGSVAVHQIQPVADPAQADRRPFDDRDLDGRRQHPAHRRAGDPGDARSSARCRPSVAVRMLRSRMPATIAQTSPVDSRRCRERRCG